MAVRRELAVLRARGGELEREIPYGIALQLLERRVAALPPPARERVLRGAAGLAVPFLTEGAAGAQHALMHGLYWVTANLADERPLVILVDDAQWADRPSLAWLNYLAQRVQDLPVVIAVAYRRNEPGADGDLIESLEATAGAQRLAPAPLSRAAITRVVQGWHEEADEPFCQACADATQGNPFLLREVLATADARGIEPTAASVQAIGALAPEGVARAVLERIARLGPGASALARAAAVLGPDAHLRHAQALLASESTAEPDSVADALD